MINSAFVLSAALLVALPSTVTGPSGWQTVPVTASGVLGVWRSPTRDPDVPFRSTVTLVRGGAALEDEERSRDEQLTKLGGTLVRDRPLRCGTLAARSIEYVVTKPSPIDSVALVIASSPTRVLVATFSRPVGTNPDSAALAWLTALCQGGSHLSPSHIAPA